MKMLKKILKISGISLLVLFLLLLAAPFLFKGKIVQAIKTTANKSLNATLNFDNDISLSFIRSFPNVSLTINKLSIVGKDSFLGDTLVYLPETRMTLDVMSAIKGEEIKVKRVFLSHPRIDIETLPGGTANWDIVKPDTVKTTKDTGGGTFKMALKSFEIEKGQLVYNDRSLGFYSELRDFDHSSNGDFTSDHFTMETSTKTPSLVLGYGGINWLYHIGTDIAAKIEMDIPTMKFSFEKTNLKLNDVNVQGDGYVDLNDNDIAMDIKFKALENNFKSFLSLVPGMYANNFNDLKATGTMAFSGFMKGKMTDNAMPAMDVKLDINNGSFRYPSLPYPADNIFLNLHYSNPDGAPDNSVVDLSKLSMTLAGEPFSLKLLLKTPVSDPFIDATAKGKLDLSKILGLIPLEKGTKLAGLIDADLSAKGNYSAATSKNYNRLDATGKLLVQKLIFQAPTDKEPYLIDALSLNFTPQKIDIPECRGSIGKNDFAINGSAENLLGYMFANETLKGNMDIKSNYLNVNSFLSESAVEEPKATDTGQVSIVELPANLDVSLNADIKKLVYDNYVLTNVGGNTRLYESKLDMKNLHANMLGGSVAIDGTYDSKNVKNPFTRMTTRMDKINFAQSLEYFPMVKKYAPVAGFINGLFNAHIDLSSILNEKMQPNYSSMNVMGDVSFTDAAIRDFDVIKEIAKQLNVNWLANLKLSNQTVKFQIKEGVFKLRDSILLPLGQGAILKLGGMTKLDQTIAYGGWIKIPRKAMGQANNVLNGWISQASSKGWNLNVEEMIPVDLLVGGTITKPQVGISLKGFKNAVINNLKEQGTKIAKDEANKKLAEGMKVAREKADKLRAEAKDKADKLREEGKRGADASRAEGKKRADQARDEADKAYNAAIAEVNKQADAMVNSSNNPIEKQAKRLAADKLRKEGAKKAENAKAIAYQGAQKIEDEGNRKGDQIESEANKKADAIEKEANDKADQVLKEAENKSKL